MSVQKKKYVKHIRAELLVFLIILVVSTLFAQRNDTFKYVHVKLDTLEIRKLDVNLLISVLIYLVHLEQFV